MTLVVNVLLVLGTLIGSGCCAIYPKMVSEAVNNEKSFRSNDPLGSNDAAAEDSTEIVSSNSFVTFGNCYRNASLQVPISGGSGRGIIVPFSNQLSLVNLSLLESPSASVLDTNGEVVLGKAVQGNFFGIFHPFNATDQDQFFPFQFHNIANNGTTVELICSQSQPVDVMVMVQDDSNVVVNARVDFEESGGGQRVELVLDNAKVKSETPLKGISKGKSSKERARFGKASKKGISIRHDKPGGVAIVNLQVRNDKGKVVHRSIVTQTRNPPAKVQPVALLAATVDDKNGDVVLRFCHPHGGGGVNSNPQPLKFDARIGIILMDGSNDTATQKKECVDVSAIVEDQTLTVHNGWIRKCLNETGLTNQTNGWDVAVLSATVSDPEDGYRVVARLMGDAVETGIRDHEPHKRRLLASPPVFDDEITTEMREGRKPQQLLQQHHHHRQRRRLRQQQPSPVSSSQHRKVLVYGYCSTTSPFPTSAFSNYVSFSDPSAPASWSHDTFARKIANFTSNLAGCGCIGHSQGGLACLHLKTYYHSCLDSPSVKGRAIQSVGSPYQGTGMAGMLASLGQIFGASCGSNSDMTYSGAQRWLTNIPSWARSQVYYYTTSFSRSKWYCNLASQFVLSNPNDGATEMSADQLSGGNNMGHTRGWCHTTGMSQPAQSTDSNRNAIMDAAAQY